MGLIWELRYARLYGPRTIADLQLGDSIKNPIEVSRELAAFWENKFFEDMSRLHIMPPDIVTRVSEYVDEIVSFVEKIEDNGFAYEGGGSVWLDVAKFEGAEGDGFRHEYAKLQPGSKGNKKLIDEGEGQSGDSLRKEKLMSRSINCCSRQEASCRFRSLESKVETRRTSLAITSMGRRTSGLAYRMFSHG